MFYKQAYQKLRVFRQGQTLERLISNLDLEESGKKKRAGKADPNGFPVYLGSSCKGENQVVQLIIPVTVLPFPLNSIRKETNERSLNKRPNTEWLTTSIINFPSKSQANVIYN